MTTTSELCHSINENIEPQFEELEFVDWNEDHLSLLLVATLRNTLRNATSISASNGYRTLKKRDENPLFLDVEAYKATGALEQRHGDIVIVVEDMDLHRTGIGFYEAKAEGPKGGYPAFNMRQLRRLSSATPELALLLYQRSKKAVSDDEYLICNRLDDASSSLKSRLLVIKANIATRYKYPDYIPDIPQTFGHHFVSRYLLGRDLNYSRDPLLSIRRWLKATRRATPLIISIRIARVASALDEPTEIIVPETEPIPFLQQQLLTNLQPNSTLHAATANLEDKYTQQLLLKR